MIRRPPRSTRTATLFPDTTLFRSTLYELHRELGAALDEAQTLRDDILPRTSEALRETQYAYDRGRYSYIELVDAQREFLALRAALIDASRNAQSLRVEMERLTNAPPAPDTHRPEKRRVGQECYTT